MVYVVQTMSQAINTGGLVGGPGPGGLNTKRLPPLETGSSNERKEKKRTEQKTSKTEKIKEDLARLEEAVKERSNATSPENTMGNQKKVSKEQNSPRKTKPSKPPKPVGLTKRGEEDLTLQATSYSLGKKKNFVTNSQKQREIDKLALDKENSNKKLQKSGILSPLADSKVPEAEDADVENRNDEDKRPGSLTINLFLSDDAISKASGVPGSDRKNLHASGRQLSVHLPLDQLDLLQSLPSGRAQPLPKIGESEKEVIDLSKTYPPPQPKPGSPSQKYSKIIGNGHHEGQTGRSLFRHPSDSYHGPVWLMGQAPKVPGRPELPPIATGQPGINETYVPPSSSYNFSQKDDDEPRNEDHFIRDVKYHREHRKKRKKHKHHHRDGAEERVRRGAPEQQPGDEKVMQWLEGHEFDVEPSEMDPELEGRTSVYERSSSVVAVRPSNVPGGYGHGGAALSGTELPEVFTMEQIATMRDMQSGMTGVGRYVGTPRAWSQHTEEFGNSTYTKVPAVESTGMHIKNIPQSNEPGSSSDILKKSASQFVILENTNQTHNSTPRTSRTLLTQQTSYSDPIRKSEMGTQTGGPLREETFYVQGTPHRSVACSTDEDKENTQQATPSARSVGIGPDQFDCGGTNNPQNDSGCSTLRSDGKQQAPLSQMQHDSQSQTSAAPSSDRNIAVELRSKNVQILKVLREDEELENSHSANRRTAHYSSNDDNKETNHRMNSSHDGMSRDDSGYPGDELDTVLGDEETYLVFLKTKDGAMIGPLQLDIDSVEVGLPTHEDILGDTASHGKNDSDNSGSCNYRLWRSACVTLVSMAVGDPGFSLGTPTLREGAGIRFY